MNSLRMLGSLGRSLRRVSLLSGIEKCRDQSTNFNRYKYTQNMGVKGGRNKKAMFENQEKADEEEGKDKDKDLDLDNREYDLIANTAMHVTRQNLVEQGVFVIQPYIKWGPKKSATTPELLIEEANALIKSLPNWSVVHSLKVPLERMEKKALFGTGKLEDLKEFVRKIRSSGRKISCIFISKGTLSFAQKQFLGSEFGLPIMDRYSVVIQILRLHATSAEAKLQVAMAEIPYIWSQLRDGTVSTNRRQGYALNDLQKELLRTRESKLKAELERIRSHRKLLRNKRLQKDYPTVAVVGYTNAGKTSLIKALTDEQAMQPRDQLFATLDVTAHAGVLPCNMEVIYMDTVGFMSDIPTGLIECFVATLEDAMMAPKFPQVIIFSSSRNLKNLFQDVIIHVQDVSHPNYLQQKLHVVDTLKSLARSTETANPEAEDSKRIINVGNKADLLDSKSDHTPYQDLMLVSSKTLDGMHELMKQLETKILKVTGRIKMNFSIPSGGEEMAWLYKNTAVVNVVGDPELEQNSLVSSIITASKLKQFNHYFKRNDGVS